MAGWGDGLRWAPDAMLTESTTNRANAATLRADHGGVLALRTPLWFGTAAERSRQDMRLMLARLESLADLLERQAEHVGEAADRLTTIKADMAALQQQATRREFEITGGGWVTSHAKLPGSLDPRRIWWAGELSGGVLAISFRLTGLDVGLAGQLGRLVLNDLADGLHQGVIDVTNTAFAGAQDLVSDGNQWLIDKAEQHWPDAVGPLSAWQRGSEKFLDEALTQPRWLQEMLYTGKLPDAAELLGGGLFQLGHGLGALTGTDLFHDGIGYVPTLRESVDMAAPRSVADLVENMQLPYQTSDWANHDDRPSALVTVVPGDPPKFIANIPGSTTGMHRAEGWTGDIEGTDWTANLKGVGTGDTAATQSAKAAIDLAIREYEAQHGPIERPQVLLTGHSQGGIIASNIASDPAFTARYQVDGLITAGSPINTIPISQDVPTTNFSHTFDPVPKVDFGGIHEQPNVTEVHLPRWDTPFSSHEPAHYGTGVHDIEGSHEHVQHLNETLAGYFGGEDAQWTTHYYDIGRMP